MKLEIVHIAKTEKMCALKLKRLPKDNYFVQLFKWNGFGFNFVKQIRDPITTKRLEIIKAF